MSGASKVMYTIANVFTWIEVLLGITGIVLASLMFVGVMPNNTEYTSAGLLSLIITTSIAVFFCLIAIMMVRRAKTSGSSKMWDVLFVILGVLGFNIFYVLGGIFGLIATK